MGLWVKVFCELELRETTCEGVMVSEIVEEDEKLPWPEADIGVDVPEVVEDKMELIEAMRVCEEV